MADDVYKDDLEKTEEPSQKRRDEARQKGQFAKSKNLIPAATLGAIAIALRFGGEELMVRMERCIIGFFGAAGNLKQFGTEAAGHLLTDADQLGGILQKLPAGWESKNLQILLHAQVIGNTPAQPGVVAAHVW